MKRFTWKELMEIDHNRYYFSKRDLAKLAELPETGIDFALPQHLLDKVVDFALSINGPDLSFFNDVNVRQNMYHYVMMTSFFVYDKKHPFGHMFSACKEIQEKIIDKVI